MADAKIRLDEDAGDSDFDLLEADDAGSDDEAAKDAMFSDFYIPEAKQAGDKGNDSVADEDNRGVEGEVDEEEEEEEYDGMPEGDDEGELSDEERELEKRIEELRGQTDGADDDAEDVEGEEEEGAVGDADGDDVTGEASDEDARPQEKGQSLYEMDKRLRALEDEVNKLEEEQLEEKPWLLRGEVSAKQRPMNSLLEVHLEQPMSYFAGRRAEDAMAGAAQPDGAEMDDGMAKALAPRRASIDIDAIIKQRVWDEAFDDVVRKKAVPPSQRPQGAEDDAVESLNFEKSRVGLADIYAKQYEADLLGHKTETEEKEDKEKTECKALFAKLMYKLDSLTNAHFTPRPPMLGLSAEAAAKVPSLKMEETIPLMVSDAALRAPEELRAPRRHERNHEELTPDERTAVRRSKKERRKKALQGKVEEGDLSLGGLRERDKALGQKNAEAKQAKLSKGVPKEQRKRLRASELLAQAAQTVASGASRKEEARKQREERPAGAPSSKKLKL